jgi:predicted DNA-binding transcriptional regulator YafY
MGRRSGTETAIEILRAFVARRRWRQAELAREVGITVPALRKHLTSWSTVVPLTSCTSHPDVFWELPRDWHPAGVLLDGRAVGDLVRILARAPKSADRDLLIALLLRRHPSAPTVSAIAATELESEEQQFLPIVEDAAARRRVLRMKYFSARRGETDWRDVSVARIYPSAPPRFVAFCHRARELRLFRVSNIASAHVGTSEEFIASDPRSLDKRERGHVDGWCDDGEQDGELVFFVAAPHDRWVRRNLRPGMRSESVDGGLRVVAPPSGLVAVARFVVGLGGAARSETPSLDAAVRALAEGALAKPLSARAVDRIRAKR